MYGGESCFTTVHPISPLWNWMNGKNLDFQRKMVVSVKNDVFFSVANPVLGLKPALTVGKIGFLIYGGKTGFTNNRIDQEHDDVVLINIHDITYQLITLGGSIDFSQIAE